MTLNSDHCGFAETFFCSVVSQKYKFVFPVTLSQKTHEIKTCSFIINNITSLDLLPGFKPESSSQVTVGSKYLSGSNKLLKQHETHHLNVFMSEGNCLESTSTHSLQHERGTTCDELGQRF